jgi:hypothetical protein
MDKDLYIQPLSKGKHKQPVRLLSLFNFYEQKQIIIRGRALSVVIIPIMLNGRVSYQKQPSEPLKRS